MKARKLKGLLHLGGIAQLVYFCETPSANVEISVPAPIQQLVDSNSHLSKTLDTLLPSRAFDHSIPLLPGVKPVNVKPYRYSPSQKDEIERQI